MSMPSRFHRGLRAARFVSPLVLTLTTLTLTAVLAASPTAAETMESTTTERNKELAQRFVDEVYNRRQLDKIPDYIADGFVDESPGAPPDARGPAWVLRQAEGTFAAFPDLKFEILRRVAEGDLVAVHWTSHGTASDQAAGGGAEGKKVEIQGISIFRYDDAGKVVGSWDIVDRLTMLRQLGLEVAPREPAQAGEGNR
jgi:steroid delta-isomerase-like uncharacterized protein